MIIDQFDLVSIACAPHETHPPLIIDADAVLALTVISKRLQPIPRGHGQGFELGRGIKLQEFPQCHPLGVGAEPMTGSAPKHIFGVAGGRENF